MNSGCWFTIGFDEHQLALFTSVRIRNNALVVVDFGGGAGELLSEEGCLNARSIANGARGDEGFVI